MSHTDKNQDAVAKGESTATHTPEPWHHNKATAVIWAETFDIEKYNGNDANVCIISRQHVKEDEAEANAARIVACVSAMAGIPNPESFMEVVKQLRLDEAITLQVRVESLRALNAELDARNRNQASMIAGLQEKVERLEKGGANG